MNRKIVRAIPALPGALLAVVCLGGCTGAGQATQPLRVMSYNTLHGEGLDGKLDLARTAEVIRQANPDIVGLNEVDNNYSSRSNFINEPQWLADALGMHVVFGETLRSGDPDNPNLYGNALLSKFPITSWKNHKLSIYRDHEPRGCIEAHIDINGQNVTVMATHLDHLNNDARVGQVADILAAAGPAPRMTILMGDFNCPPPHEGQDAQAARQSEPVAMILERFKDTFVLAGQGLAGSFGDGSRRIDYIFVSPDLADRVKWMKVVRTDLTAVASDHMPVMALIE